MVKNSDSYGIRETDAPGTSEWFHVALVLQGDKFIVYHDANEVASQDLDWSSYRDAGSGDVIIGIENSVLSSWSTWSLTSDAVTPRGSTTAPPLHGSITLDELLMWNKALTADQVTQIHENIPETNGNADN